MEIAYTRDFTTQLFEKREYYMSRIRDIIQIYSSHINRSFAKTEQELIFYGFTNTQNILKTRQKKIDCLFNLIEKDCIAIFYSDPPSFHSFCSQYDVFEDMLTAYITHIPHFNHHYQNNQIDLSLWGLKYTLNQFDNELGITVNQLHNAITLEFYNIMDEYT